MHNVDTQALERTVEQARRDPSSVRQPVDLSGEWQVKGGPQFRATIPYPGGEVEFVCDFPPSMGGAGRAPNPLAYCFWGGLACYAMTFAAEAAREGVELKALRGRVVTEVDMTRALGLSERAPVELLAWTLEVETDASAGTIEALKARADERCPGVYCIRNPVPLETRVARAGAA